MNKLTRNFIQGHVGFVINPLVDGQTKHRLMYIDKDDDGENGSFWGDVIVDSVAKDTTYSIVVSINRSGNTKIYLNGSSNAVYDKATVFKHYNGSYASWSHFSIGGCAQSMGGHVCRGAADGYTPCVFQYLKIYLSTYDKWISAQFHTNLKIF